MRKLILWLFGIDSMEAVRQEARKAAVEHLVDLFGWYLNFGTPSEHFPGWSKSDLLRFKYWMEQAIRDRILATYRQEIGKSVKESADGYFQSEEFLDRIIDRINRKQVRIGIPPIPGADPSANSKASP